MKILWLCNMMLPIVAEHMGLPCSNKEGWLSGLCTSILERQADNQLDLHVAFPVHGDMDGVSGTISTGAGSLHYYGFEEDMNHPELYDEELENRLCQIVDLVKPDVIHCFGTEYPHTLAMCRIVKNKKRVLIGLQGLCTAIAEVYMADMPQKVAESRTLRDWLRKDSLKEQQRKFYLRGINEVEAVRLVGNVTGRTSWDRSYALLWNKDIQYYAMNETLRPCFYHKKWEAAKAQPYSIFVSQGNYPIKGLHYMLMALAKIHEKYPDASIYVAGDDLTKYQTIKEKLKISGYGVYLRQLIRQGNLEKKVHFLGNLNAEQMRDAYCNCSVFVCCSAMENSPNSLGEAMLLGMPCVAANVGGVSSIFEGGKDGILYDAHDNNINNVRNQIKEDEYQIDGVVESLKNAVFKIWENGDKTEVFCANARKHAKMTHDKENNYQIMTEMYANINALAGE